MCFRKIKINIKSKNTYACACTMARHKENIYYNKNQVIKKVGGIEYGIIETKKKKKSAI